VHWSDKSYYRVTGSSYQEYVVATRWFIAKLLCFFLLFNIIPAISHSVVVVCILSANNNDELNNYYCHYYYYFYYYYYYYYYYFNNLDRRVNNAVVSTYKYFSIRVRVRVRVNASPKDSLPGFTVSAFWTILFDSYRYVSAWGILFTIISTHTTSLHTPANHFTFILYMLGSAIPCF
jgi:hypothetical protein